MEIKNLKIKIKDKDTSYISKKTSLITSLVKGEIIICLPPNEMSSPDEKKLMEYFLKKEIEEIEFEICDFFTSIKNTLKGIKDVNYQVFNFNGKVFYVFNFINDYSIVERTKSLTDEHFSLLSFNIFGKNYLDLIEYKKMVN